MKFELDKLVERGKRAISVTNTKKQRNQMTDIEAMAYVLGRLDNIRRYIKDNRDGFTFFPDSWKIRQIARASGLEWKEELLEKDLHEMEHDAGLPEGSAGYGSCMRCGRTLTNPDSVKAGIGPICINKKPGEK